MTSTKDWFASDDPHPRNDSARKIPAPLPLGSDLGPTIDRFRETATKAEIVEWPLEEMETEIRDLQASLEIFGLLISASHDSEVSAEAWYKLKTDLARRGERIEELWNLAWDQRNAEIAALKAEHAAALATVRAEKAAPGSVETVKQAEAMWSLLWAVTQVATDRCAEAGYPLRQCVDLTASKPSRGNSS